MLSENFALWDPEVLLVDVQKQPPPLKGSGTWRLGPGTEVPPRLQRLVRAAHPPGGFAPLGHWCACISNEDPLTDYGPSGLVYAFPRQRPRLLAYRCRALARRPHRSGAVLALAHGLGNDKGPERPAVMASLARDGHGRQVLVSGYEMGKWEEGAAGT